MMGEHDYSDKGVSGMSVVGYTKRREMCFDVSSGLWESRVVRREVLGGEGGGRGERGKKGRLRKKKEDEGREREGELNGGEGGGEYGGGRGGGRGDKGKSRMCVVQ
jgi:hypothetical protein